MDKLITVCVLFFTANKCLDAEIIYSNEEITWLDEPNNYNLVVDFQNTTISLCKVNDACQHISTFPVNDTSPEPLSLLTQKGVNIHIFTNSGNQTQCYRVKEKFFQSCRLPDISNHTSIVIDTASEYITIPGETFILGENLIICDGASSDNDNNTSCPIGCRLNITVRDVGCSINDSGHQIICSDKGDCTSRIDEEDFTCKCWDGFTGVNCEVTPLDISIDIQCSNKHCMNGGTCVPVLYPTNSSDKTRCECPLHVAGELCETVLNSCTSSPCVNGVCVEKEGGYECFCVPGFHGEKCELEYNECLSNPCLNEGTCIDRIDKYQCACSTGYTGINCERKINFCETSPCKHNGTCTNLERSYQCHCSHGYTGETCEHRIRECSSGPCKNHGTCIEFNHGYKCLCPVTFAGVHCEYMMDVFAPPMEGAGMSSDSHKHNLYIVAATLGSMILIVVSVIIACYCKIYETYKQVMWKRLRYNRKRSNSCPDMESCNDNNPVNKHRLSADAIWEATSLCHDNAAFEHHGNHHTFTNFQI